MSKYIVIAVISFFAGVVSASTVEMDNALPSKDKIVSSFQKSHLQDQAY
jgi:hypothetical protein